MNVVLIALKGINDGSQNLNSAVHVKVLYEPMKVLLSVTLVSK